MSDLDPNPFGPPAISWSRAVLPAFWLDAALIAIVLGIFATSSGADNPVSFYAALALQFPASLLFRPVFDTLSGFVTSSGAALTVAAAVVALVQFILLTLLLKRPWR